MTGAGSVRRPRAGARGSRGGGHEVVLAWGDDGNCANPVAPTLEIPVPSPLGLPEAIARHTFPLASRLGLMGCKPVRSFEEVLWLTGALDERYTRAAVDALRAHMRAIRPDVVYSEFSLAAVIAARAEGITYNRFIQGLGLAGVEVDRRMLAELAVNEPAAFKALVETARKALPEDVNAPRA